MSELGKLEKVELRDVWKTEDQDFTPWLAEEESLKILGDTIGIELELEALEKNVGPFRADILCKNIDDDSWVLVENQIERTDHRHLGQLLTYAAGLQAVTIVWIASEFTDEHRATLDWLNKITDDNFRFFGLEVELWRINDSLPGPKFNITSKPNDWSKSISQAANHMRSQPTTKTKEMQLKYWQKLKENLIEHNVPLKPQEPRPRHWCNFSIGRGGVRIAAFINTREERISVEFNTLTVDTKPFYHLLLLDKEGIEAEIGESLVWKELPGQNSSKIVLFKDADPSDETEWQQQFDWLREKLELFDQALRPRIKKLNPADWQMEENEELTEPDS